VDDEHTPDSGLTTVRATMEFLADPVVAAGALAEISCDDEHSAVTSGVFAESAEPLTPRAAHPALHRLLSPLLVLDHSGVATLGNLLRLASRAPASAVSSR
jgi:hypothetical protein